jgi:anhydro-N-acetylmuramic acid kinase
LPAQDVQATLCELTARSIAAAITDHAPATRRLLVCGGGVHNTWLQQRLERALPGTIVESTAAHGLDPDWVEAAAFAWLAGRALAGKPGNIPAVTGASRPVVLGRLFRKR